eukprot:scaffold24355_cov74-Skeletonema_dohrnii-CCMP3373.AAC.1
MASSGHLRCCSDADTSNKYLSREKDASILSWPTREIRYGRQQRNLQRLKWPHQVTYDVVATPIRPTILEPLKRCFYTIMANCYESLEAVDCHIHS